MVDVNDTACPDLEEQVQPSLINSLVTEQLSIDEIRLPARMVTKISTKEIAIASANLTQFGQPGPIIVSRQLEVISGHVFLVAARQLGWPHLFAVRLENLTKNEARVYSLALSKLAELSSWDHDTLKVELRELLDLNFDFELDNQTGFEIAEIDLLLDPPPPNHSTDPLDDVPETPKPAEVVSRTGDNWQLCEHRLFCGNALQAKCYTILLSGNKAALVVTDPPYNIPIKNNVSGLGKIKHGDFTMGSGEMSIEQFTEFNRTYLELCKSVCRDGSLINCFMDRRHLRELLNGAADAELKIIDLCVWDKMSGGMGSYYRSQHEPVLVFKVGDAPHRNNIELGRHGRNRTNVWAYPGQSSFGRNRQHELAMHPTVKPVALVADAIKDSTRRGEIVLDPFVGSGTTIIAAQKCGRICYGMEIDPAYVDTAVQRWQSAFNKQAILSATGETFDEVAERRRSDNSDRPKPIAPQILPVRQRVRLSQ